MEKETDHAMSVESQGTMRVTVGKIRQSVRNVLNVSHGGQGQPDQGQNSGQHAGQQPQTQQSTPNQATQYRASRISELN